MATANVPGAPPPPPLPGPAPQPQQSQWQTQWQQTPAQSAWGPSPWQTQPRRGSGWVPWAIGCSVLLAVGFGALVIFALVIAAGTHAPQQRHTTTRRVSSQPFVQVTPSRTVLRAQS